VVMMVSAPIESEWMMTLSWIVRLDIHISAALIACSSAKVIGVWFGKLNYLSSPIYSFFFFQLLFLFSK